MNLYNLSEKDFDAEIKNHLADASVPYDPLSWESMNQKLDASFSQFPATKTRTVELVATTLLLSAFFFWNLGTFNARKPIELNSSSPAQTFDRGQVQPNEQPPKDQPASASNLSEQPDKVEPPENNAKYTVGTNDLKPDRQTAASESIESKITNTNNGDASNQLKSTASAGEYRDSQPYPLTNLTTVGPETAAEEYPQLPDQLQTVDMEENPPVIKTSSSSWFIGLSYSPDISMVGFGETSQPGTNFGALVEFQLNRRWSINSGMVYSRKNYAATGEDYNPPEGFWDYGIYPKNTDATCDVIDIPINIRYYFFPAKTNRFFASTGLSTYLMLTEDYYYHYEDPYNPNLLESWNVNNENRHFFGIYNFSIGYQRAIGKQWFMEIEPFIKLPLSGVGFGRVDLWSTGSSFSLKYNFK